MYPTLNRQETDVSLKECIFNFNATSGFQKSKSKSSLFTNVMFCRDLAKVLSFVARGMVNLKLLRFQFAGRSMSLQPFPFLVARLVGDQLSLNPLRDTAFLLSSP